MFLSMDSDLNNFYFSYNFLMHGATAGHDVPAAIYAVWLSHNAAVFHVYALCAAAEVEAQQRLKWSP